MDESDYAKIQAAAAAAAMIKPGSIVGLGTGSTASHFIRLLGARVERGLTIQGVATSEASDALARECGIAVIDPNMATRIDIAVDGADEADGALNLIKGGGGALLREKIVASAADHFVAIVDPRKQVETLGAFPLPVEVSSFGFSLTAAKLYRVLRDSGCGGSGVALRERAGGEPYVTDGGNYILDCHCKTIPDPAALARAIDGVVGVVEHGLFVGIARTLIVGGPRGASVIER